LFAVLAGTTNEKIETGWRHPATPHRRRALSPLRARLQMLCDDREEILAPDVVCRQMIALHRPAQDGNAHRYVLKTCTWRQTLARRDKTLMHLRLETTTLSNQE
jgi:hypothetical protein